jgi:hypothetical protein
MHSVVFSFGERTSEQLESRPFPPKDAGSHRSAVDADADAQLARVRAELVLQLLHDVVKRHQAVSRKPAHGERMVFARHRDAACSHVAVSNGFNLLKYVMTQDIKHG